MGGGEERWKQWENNDHLAQVVADCKGDKRTGGEEWGEMCGCPRAPDFAFQGSCGWLLCAQGRGARALQLRLNPLSANVSLHTHRCMPYSQSHMESSSESTCSPPHPDWSVQRALWGLQLHIVTTLVYAFLWQKNQDSIQIWNLIISSYCITGNWCIFRCSRNPQRLQGKILFGTLNFEKEDKSSELLLRWEYILKSTAKPPDQNKTKTLIVWGCKLKNM